MSSSKRHFTVIIESEKTNIPPKEHGLYISSTPSSAARKAVSKLCADNKKKKVEFYMRETTKGSNKKVYGPYLGEMKKLDKPIELKGRIIQYAVNVHLKKKVGNKLRGGRIEENGIFEPSDFIFPIEYLNTDIAIRIKKNPIRKNQKCFFMVPNKVFIPSEQKNVIWYKYAAYYSNKYNKPRIMTFDILSKDIIEKDIEEIPNNKEGYEFLRTLIAILQSNQDQPADFINKVEEEFRKKPNPYKK
jgi:hypothetical protein